MNFTETEEYKKLVEKYPLLRRAKECEAGLKKETYIIVDTETTGLDPIQNEIIEVAALKIKGDEILDSFHHLINIHKPIPKEIERLTGISQDMVDDGDDKNLVLEEFVQFVGDTTLVAHNADFDLGFIKNHVKLAADKEIKNKALCTLKLSRKFIQGLVNYKLMTVADHFKVPTPNLHRAMADVEITHQVWMHMIEVLHGKGYNTFEQVYNTQG